MAIEIEQFVKAEKNERGIWTLELNPSITEFVALLAEKYRLTEKDVVEKLMAGGIDIAYREEEGKQILVKDHTDKPDKTIHLFKRSSS